MDDRYVIAWGPEVGPVGTEDRIHWGARRPTQHAAILDAIDLFWRDPGVNRVNIFCGDELISTLHRSDRRISATLAALEHAVRDIYEEESG